MLRGQVGVMPSLGGSHSLWGRTMVSSVLLWLYHFNYTPEILRAVAVQLLW